MLIFKCNKDMNFNKILPVAALCMFATQAMAQMPVVQTKYTADPAPGRRRRL